MKKKLRICESNQSMKELNQNKMMLEYLVNEVFVKDIPHPNLAIKRVRKNGALRRDDKITDKNKYK